MLTIRSKVVPFSFSVSTTLCFKSCSHFLWTLQETRHLVMGQQVNWTSSELGIMWPTEPQKRMSNKYKLISAYASLGQSRSENTSKVHGLGTQTILVLSPLLYLPSLSSHLQSHGGGGFPTTSQEYREHARAWFTERFPWFVSTSWQWSVVILQFHTEMVSEIWVV